MVVTVAHIAMAAVLLSQELKPLAVYEPDALVIELAERTPEIEVPPDPIEPLLEPEPTIIAESPPPAPAQTEPSVAPPSDPTPATNQPSAEPQTPTVLTQLDTAPAGPTAAVSRGTEGDETPVGELPGDMVTPAQVASALEQMHCLKLKRHEDGACPPPDPFQVAIESAKRAIPPERLFGDPRYVSKTVSDKLFEREATERFNWPDADLFNDPMAPGAYNARRIRNGQEPLWSREMRESFRKSED